MKTLPTLLLHSCCAPCSSSVLERLASSYSITLYYYNPNLDTTLEHARRAEELEKLHKLNLQNQVQIIVEPYTPADYDAVIKDLEHLGEGSQRCYNCIELRMRQTAAHALAHHFDFFTTTLSVSPYKKSAWIHEIGSKLAKEYNIQYLAEDFKKQDGYKRSLDLSKTLGLYRQSYCGCKYSKQESLARTNRKHA